jgi:hypothetical protein
MDPGPNMSGPKLRGAALCGITNAKTCSRKQSNAGKWLPGEELKMLSL